MLLQHLFDHLSPSLLLVACIVGLAAHLLHNKFGGGLNHVPGPFWASFTEFYRLFVVWRRRPEQWHIRLHERYGPFVRIGPRTVICSDYSTAKKIYALNAGYTKVREVDVVVISILSNNLCEVGILPSTTRSGKRSAIENVVHFDG
jgi:hypothetical protein